MIASLPFEFDFKNPDYVKVFDHRLERLKRIREKPEVVPHLKQFYRENIAQFIIDWGCTNDPRNADIGLPSTIPFLLYPRQIEWVEWVLERWRNREPGVNAKSRETGVTWLAVAVACSICIFKEGVSIGFGSRRADYVDTIGDPKSIFYKVREFISHLPSEFRGGWTEKENSKTKLITIPATGSKITGDSGDNIGRGGRNSLYFVDESAWLEHDHLVDAALSQTTKCRIDISTPHGQNNSFAKKFLGGKIPSFRFHWRDDPRKDDAWYEKTCRDLHDDPVVIAQEIDMDFTASITGLLIPSGWIQSSINAIEKLGIKNAGIRLCGLDVADEGSDLNASAGRYGVELQHLSKWSGIGGDIYKTTEKAIRFCDENDYGDMLYDADGLGAGVRGDAKNINEIRHRSGVHIINFKPFRGSGAVVMPEGVVYAGENRSKDRLNKDYFANHKAQSWFSLRNRFLKVHRWVSEGIVCDPADIISIHPKLPYLSELCAELSQPTYEQNNRGQMIIQKKPDGARSPNLADAVMIAFSPQEPPRRGAFDV